MNPQSFPIKTLITPAPVCANMIQTLVHTCRGLGCSIFIETYVKRQSNPLPFKVCSIQQCTEHIQPSTIISKNDSKKCVHFGTTARVIRVNPHFKDYNGQWKNMQIVSLQGWGLLCAIFNSDFVLSLQISVMVWSFPFLFSIVKLLYSEFRLCTLFPILFFDYCYLFMLHYLLSCIA